MGYEIIELRPKKMTKPVKVLPDKPLLSLVLMPIWTSCFSLTTICVTWHIPSPSHTESGIQTHIHTFKDVIQ